MTTAIIVTLAKISATPNPNGLPGANVMERVVNGLFFYTLLACLAGLFISVLVWVLSARASNYNHAAYGRHGTFIAAGGALITGAAPALINFFQGLGSQIH